MHPDNQTTKNGAVIANDFSILTVRAASMGCCYQVERSESERMRMEMESRDSGEQLREMAEKVFQLLERLKLAELAKNKAMEV